MEDGLPYIRVVLVLGIWGRGENKVFCLLLQIKSSLIKITFYPIL